jgi:hypothetical protein
MGVRESIIEVFGAVRRPWEDQGRTTRRNGG